MVGDRRGRAALLCTWLALQACASGYAPEFAEPQDVLPGRPTEPGEGTGNAGSGPLPSEPYMGDSCQMGQSEACTCESGGMGTRICRFDVRSPTQGTYGECLNCGDPGTAGNGGGTGGSASGTGGSGGGTGGTGTGGSSSGTGGTGGTGSGTGGSGTGTGGSSGGTGGVTAGTGGTSGGSPSRPGWCVFVPVPIPGVC